MQWLPRWKTNGWRTSVKQPVKNADLWRRLDEVRFRAKGTPVTQRTSVPTSSPCRRAEVTQAPGSIFGSGIQHARGSGQNRRSRLVSGLTNCSRR